jgi:hypothetical protein
MTRSVKLYQLRKLKEAMTKNALIVKIVVIKDPAEPPQPLEKIEAAINSIISTVSDTIRTKSTNSDTILENLARIQIIKI